MPNNPPDPNIPGASDSPSTLENTPITINSVIGIPELGSVILGYLDDGTCDMCGLALISRAFYRAAQFHLWKAIRVPYLEFEPLETARWIHEDEEEEDEANQILPFWERYKENLERHTRSLVVNLRYVNPGLYKALATIDPSRPVDDTWRAGLLADLDVFYDGVRKLLAQTKHLVKFTGRNVPGMLDLTKLVHSYHPHIQDLKFSAILRDPVGLRLVLRREPRPSWMSTILDQTSYPPNPLTNLDLSNLWILSLTDLTYNSYEEDEKVLDLVPLVYLLGSAPNLAHLGLSLCQDAKELTANTRHTSGRESGYLNGYSRNPLYFLDHLHMEYDRPCFQPLRLQTLRLGPGCNVNDITDSRLVNLDQLTELHIERPIPRGGVWATVVDESIVVPGRSPTKCNSWLDSVCWVKTPRIGKLSRLRKITVPWGLGRLLWDLDIYAREPQLGFRNVTLRVDPSPKLLFKGTLQCSQWFDMCDLVKRNQYRSLNGYSVTLEGLVLPTDETSPDESIQFVHCVLVWARGLEALKIRLPKVSAILEGKLGMESEKRKPRETGILCMRSKKIHPGRDPLEFWNILSRMTLLRELWLADGLGDWDHPVRRTQRVNEPYLSKATFRRLVSDIVYLLPRLVYLRILDRAWHVKWTDPGCTKPNLDPAVVNEGYSVCRLHKMPDRLKNLMWPKGSPTRLIKPLMAYEVDRCLPDAFDWGPPKVEL
ncbi:hypothetical protein B0J18DRAFT_209254 [Chaetomium sp. MPI-SDFR-AT-0129]|nr:hypothetical protein B0J18DRAFT_209254 [Chaetomium sp. MPI-SDFR-AT-0129]